MRVLFVNQHYWPDIASTGQHLTDLAEYLAEKGHTVEVLCARGRYQAGRSGAPRRERHHGVAIRRVWTPGLGRGTNAGRITEYAAFYLGVLRELVFGRRRDAVVLLTTPPLLAAAGAIARAVRRRSYGIWSMDLHPDAEFGLGMIDPDRMLGRLLRLIDEWSLRQASFMVDLGRYMKDRLIRKGVPAGRLTTIPVWSRADEIEPVAAADNPLRARLGLGDAFVVMYSGNAGLAHRFEEVLDAAEILRGDPSVRFLFVGDGPRRREIETRVATAGLQNVTYLDYFPREDLRYSLAVGDLHLLTLRSEMAGVAVPGKLYGIMAAGRPVVVVGPARSEPADTVVEEQVGTVIDPDAGGDGAAVADAIRASRDDPAARSEAGRRAREAFLGRYERGPACTAWEELLLRVVGEGRPAGSGATGPPAGGAVA